MKYKYISAQEKEEMDLCLGVEKNTSLNEALGEEMEEMEGTSFL